MSKTDPATRLKLAHDIMDLDLSPIKFDGMKLIDKKINLKANYSLFEQGTIKFFDEDLK